MKILGICKECKQKKEIEVEVNDVVKIIYGNELWNYGFVVSIVDVEQTTLIIVRVQGHADRAYYQEDFNYYDDCLTVNL